MTSFTYVLACIFDRLQ